MAINTERKAISANFNEKTADTSSLEDLSKKLQLSSYDTGPEFLSDEDRQLWVNIIEKIGSDWESMTDIERHNTWNYVRAQVNIRDGNVQEAREILSDLDETTGFREYEDKFFDTLKTIEIEVTGSTPRGDKGLTPY